jgi:hypothetical protein
VEGLKARKKKDLPRFLSFRASRETLLVILAAGDPRQFVAPDEETLAPFVDFSRNAVE